MIRLKHLYLFISLYCCFWFWRAQTKTRARKTPRSHPLQKAGGEAPGPRRLRGGPGPTVGARAKSRKLFFRCDETCAALHRWFLADFFYWRRKSSLSNGSLPDMSPSFLNSPMTSQCTAQNREFSLRFKFQKNHAMHRSCEHGLGGVFLT